MNRVRKLASEADIIVEGFNPGYLDSIGLGYDDALGARNSFAGVHLDHPLRPDWAI